MWNTAAILEWIIALIYILYVASFVMDFVPAVKTKHHRFPGVDEIEGGGQQGHDVDMSGGPAYSTNGSYSNEQQMSDQQAGIYYSPPQGPVPTSRNF